MKILLSIVLMLFPISFITAQDYAVGDTILVTANANLLPKPDFYSKTDSLIAIKKGMKKVIHQISSNYIKVDIDGKTGWLHQIYITNWRVIKENLQREKEREELRRMSLQREREEEERIEKHNQFLRDKGYGLKLNKMSFSINSADGISPLIVVENIDVKKIIKYIKFTLTPFNTVGDITEGRINNKSTIEVRGVGPIKPGDQATYTFDNLWYNGTIGCIETYKIEVEYMDGSFFTYLNDLEDIRKEAKNVNLRGDCRYN